MTLVVLDGGTPQIIRRVPEGVARRENDLRDLLFQRPEILPIEDINPTIEALVPVAKELNVPGVGRIDAFFADGRGNMVIVECKLWRNPQARREVVGQILDYARALARFSYDDLQREVSRSTAQNGNALYQMVRSAPGALSEARFVDQVSRNLAAGRFLLIVAGDGITEGTRRIGEYLVAQPGLAFDFALVEMAEYAWSDPNGVQRTVIQPRLLAQTAVIERMVIRNETQVVLEDLRDEESAPTPSASDTSGRKLDPALLKQWRDFVDRFIRATKFDDPSQPPPRVGGFGWMRLPLPAGHSLTLWRSTAQGQAGAFASFSGPEKQSVYEELLADRLLIDAEFKDVGLQAPDWEANRKGGQIGLTFAAPLPWDRFAEDQQLQGLQAIANQMVNSLRPRLERTGR